MSDLAGHKDDSRPFSEAYLVHKELSRTAANPKAKNLLKFYVYKQEGLMQSRRSHVDKLTQGARVSFLKFGSDNHGKLGVGNK